MLSRIAESLFWVGRYLERAEDTARILDVHHQQLLEHPSIDEQASCRSLLEVMGVELATAASPDAEYVLRLLAYDAANPSSIVGSLRAGREGARGAREAISSEMWECVNSTWIGLDEQLERAALMGPHGFFRYVKDRVGLMQGLTDSTMSRDDGWRFLVLGRSLERVDMTARLLADRFSTEADMAEWVAILRSCSAHEAFLRTYRRAVEGHLVAEFLLLDRLFPRSVFAALLTAEQVLVELDPAANRVGLPDEARRLIGRARSDLEFRHVGELLDDLPVHLEALQVTCAEVSSAVGRRYFQAPPALAWSWERAELAAGSPHLAGGRP